MKPLMKRAVTGQRPLTLGKTPDAMVDLCPVCN